jgi:aminoglycoside 6'-N-acetyltransferase
MSSADPGPAASGAGRPRPPAELVGRSVVLVPVGPEHVEPLARIIEEPSIARWWSDTASWVRRRLLEPDQDVIGFAIMALPERDVIGYLQAWEELDPEFRHAGIDLFVTTDRQGRGHGPDAIRSAIRWLIEERGHHRITIDPVAENVRAIRAYEKVGFRRVGVLRRYQRLLDGAWHDGLLMDLLADELSPD